jgi:UDP-N-acetyl-D-mannosaminuronic acid dehydrogenase
VATNHPEFCGRNTLRAILDSAKGDALIVDPWNCWGQAEVLARASEVAARAAGAVGSRLP